MPCREPISPSPLFSLSPALLAATMMNGFSASAKRPPFLLASSPSTRAYLQPAPPVHSVHPATSPLSPLSPFHSSFHPHSPNGDSFNLPPRLPVCHFFPSTPAAGEKKERGGGRRGEEKRRRRREEKRGGASKKSEGAIGG